MAYDKEQKDAIIQDVCYQIAEEGKSLRSILKDENLPAMSTFMKWISESEQYARAYATAVELRADLLVEDILNIADNVGQDMVENEDGIPVINHAVIQRDRLRVDSRKWLAARMNPKKYGDKLNLEADVTNKIKPIRLIPVEPKKKSKKDGK